MENSATDEHMNRNTSSLSDRLKNTKKRTMDSMEKTFGKVVDKASTNADSKKQWITLKVRKLAYSRVIKKLTKNGRDCPRFCVSQ